MNIYRHLGDCAGSAEARQLADELVQWHDSMVKHLRVAGPYRGDACEDGCPHEEAKMLWPAALATFGRDANQLAFLRRHGQSAAPPPRRAAVSART